MNSGPVAPLLPALPLLNSQCAAQHQYSAIALITTCMGSRPAPILLPVRWRVASALRRFLYLISHFLSSLRAERLR